MDNSKRLHSSVELKDGRKLLTYSNGFVYAVESAKGVVEIVSEQYYRNQMKHRLTKKNKS